MPGNMRTMLGTERLSKALETLESQREALKDSSLPDEAKEEVDRELAAAVRRLTTGSVIRQLGQLDSMEQPGQDPLHAAFEGWVTRLIDNHGPEAEISTLKKAIEDLRAAPAAKADPFRELMEEVAVDHLRKRLSGSDTTAVARAEDPVEKAFRQHLATKMERLLDEKPKDPLETLMALKESLDRFKALFPQPAPAAIGVSEDVTLKIEMRRIEAELEREKYRIDRETEAQTAKTNAWRDIADTLSGLGEKIGIGLARGGGEAEAPASAPAAQRQEPNSLVCPSCRQRGIYVAEAAKAKIRAGQRVNVACTECGEVHSLGAKGAAPDKPPAPPAAMADDGAEKPDRPAPPAAMDPLSTVGGVVFPYRSATEIGSEAA